MWGDIANMNIDEGQILAIRNAGVSEYGGKSLNISNEKSVIEVNPEDEPRYHDLKKWYAQVKSGAEVKIEKLTVMGEGGVNTELLPIVTISQIKKSIMEDQDFLSGQSNQPRYFKTHGDCSIMKGSMAMGGEKLLHYPCCPKPDCKKKVNPEGNGFRCEKCM